MSSVYGQHTIMINYDLRKPDRNYDAVEKTIKSFDAWAHALESLWFVGTSQNAATLHDKLKSCMDQNDGLIVLDVDSGDWKASGIDPEVVNWMRNRMKVH